MSEMIAFTDDILFVVINQTTSLRRPVGCLVVSDVPIGTGDGNIVLLELILQIEIHLHKRTKMLSQCRFIDRQRQDTCQHTIVFIIE